MFEVVLTYRDFTEQIVDRYPTEEEARLAAEWLSSHFREELMRAWVRQAGRVKSPRP